MITVINIPTYTTHLVVADGSESARAIRKVLKQHNLPTERVRFTPHRREHAYTINFDAGHNLVWLSQPLQEHIEDGTLVHELVHVACNILHNRGVDTCWRNQEPLAYLTQHLWEATLEAFDQS
jgi:hypothetical protein